MHKRYITTVHGLDEFTKFLISEARSKFTIKNHSSKVGKYIVKRTTTQRGNNISLSIRHFPRLKITTHKTIILDMCFFGKKNSQSLA